jgi:hypothetical protein
MSLTIQGGNIAGVDKSPALLDAIAFHKPDVAVLTEAYHYDQDVPGYQRVQYSKKHGAEARDVLILVRDGLKIKRRALVKLTKAWYGPFTLRKRAPRRYIVVVVIKDGVKYPVMGVHFPPGGPNGGVKTRGRNRSAWRQSARRVKRWLRIRSLAVALGDFNGNGKDVREFVAPKGAIVDMASNVDGAAAKAGELNVISIPHPRKMHGWFRGRVFPA